MASANVADVVSELMQIEIGAAESSQNVNLESDYYGPNRYRAFQSRVGNPRADGEWETQTWKRKRHNTNSVDAEMFSQTGTDEKIVVYVQ